jgi:hypothetical protein
MRYELSEFRTRLEMVKSQGLPTEIDRNLGERPFDVGGVSSSRKARQPISSPAIKRARKALLPLLFVFGISISRGLL